MSDPPHTIRVGTASWTDPTLIKSGRFYPKGCTTAELAIAWVAARGGDVVPLIGAKRPAQLASALRALDVKLSADDLARIEQAMPAQAVAGTRYGAPLMAHLDSEHAS